MAVRIRTRTNYKPRMPAKPHPDGPTAFPARPSIPRHRRLVTADLSPTPLTGKPAAAGATAAADTAARGDLAVALDLRAGVLRTTPPLGTRFNSAASHRRATRRHVGFHCILRLRLQHAQGYKSSRPERRPPRKTTASSWQTYAEMERRKRRTKCREVDAMARSADVVLAGT